MADRKEFSELLEIMRRLRAPGGCPWDAKQTIGSLTRYILEEAHELVEAIEDGSPRGICEECGDVLLQVVFVSQIASETGLFDITDVTDAICRKLIGRHPHVFGDASVRDAEEVTRNWERIKAEERAGRDEDSSAMAGIPRGLPALLRALRLSERAARKGFDWRPGDTESVRAKLLEEADELRAEIERGDGPRAEEELGDLLFAAANLARHIGADPEAALQKANAKFDRRFRAMEHLAETRGIGMEGADLETLEGLWQEVKAAEKSEPTVTK